jgi:hypothetical protein
MMIDRCEDTDWHFGRWGIPSAQISVADRTGSSAYASGAAAASFSALFALQVANRVGPPAATGPYPDPRRACIAM